MAKKRPKQRATTPAEGERRSLIGIVPQYRACAWLVLQHLRRGTLEFLELTHPAAGQVDDIVIGSAGRVDGYQVKWHEHPGTLTLHGLTKPAMGGGESLITQLASGWLLLRRLHPGARVVVHLFTCDYASVQNTTRGRAKDAVSLARFLGEAWHPFRAGDVQAASWHATVWNQLQRATNLDNAVFFEFVRCCELELGARVAPDQLVNDRDAHLLSQQVRELAGYLKDLVVDPARKYHFSRADLLQQVGWQHYFQPRNRHDFDIPGYYEPIDATISALKAAIASLPGGYLALVGPPGSGKSTLLTRMFEERTADERWVRYYAFVPGSQEAANTRGEAENFLHDLTLSLESVGFYGGTSRSAFERQQLASRLDAQLQQLGQNAAETGQRWVVLIDGLDHVPREQRVARSFLNDLPLPERLPPGVFLLLGSQTTELLDLPPGVRTSLQQSDRTVSIAPLARHRIHSIAEQRLGHGVLTSSQLESVYSLSAGHPLALGLLLNQLTGAASPEDVALVLEGTQPYTGDIDAVYQAHWFPIQQDFALVRLLALIARLRRHVDLAWLHQWAAAEPLDTLKTTLRHLFRQESPTRWYFFHNSFRLFIRGRTGLIAGATAAANEQALHRELAEFCASPAAPAPWAWEQLFHRVDAGEHDRVLDLATASYFRDQLFAFRPIDAITTDIRHALRSAGVRRDIVACVRLVLCAAEMHQRADAMDDIDLPCLLLDLKLGDAAVEHIFDGLEPRVAGKAAMDLSRRLRRASYQSDAQHLFDRGEPLEYVNGNEHRGLSNPERRKALAAWIKAAIHFRPLSQILAIVDSIRHVPRDTFGGDVDDSDARKKELCFSLCVALDRDGRVDDARVVERRFDLTTADGFDLWFWVQARRWKGLLDAGDRPAVISEVAPLLVDPRTQGLDGSARTYLAEVAYLAMGATDPVQNLIGGIEQPNVDNEIRGEKSGLVPYLFRFRLNRLLAALGRKPSPLTVVPDARDAQYQGGVLFERAVVQLATIWGDAWRGKIYSPADVRQYTAGLLRLYDRSSKEHIRWLNWSVAQAAQAELYETLISAVALHGQDALSEIKSLLMDEWRKPQRRQLWPTALRRTLLLKFYETGSDLTRTRAELQKLEANMLEGLDSAARTEECRAHVEALLRVGQRSHALHWARRLLETSFGVGYGNDLQMDEWIRWLPSIHRVDPEGTAQRVTWFARALVKLNETTDGPSARSAAKELLDVVMPWSPRRAVRLLEWLREQRIVGYSDCIDLMLRRSLTLEPRSLPAVLACFTQFLLRFSAGDHDSLAALCVKTAFGGGGADRAIQVGIRIIDAAAVFGFARDRASLVHAVLKSLARCNVVPPSSLSALTAQWPTRSPSYRSDDGIRLKSGGPIQETELRRRTATVDGLLALVDDAEPASLYHLRTALEDAAGQASIGDIPRLEAAARRFDRPSLILAALSRRASALGQRDTARRLADDALATSSDYGWSFRSDGATRIRALEALVLADPVHGRDVAFETFIRAVAAPRSFPGGMSQNLKRILPLLSDTVPIEPIWAELDAHLRLLCPMPTGGPMPDVLTEPEDDVPQRAVCDLLVFHMSEPTCLIEEGSQHALAALCRERDERAIESLRGLLTGTDNEVTSAIALVAALARENPDLIRPLADTVAPLALHPNLAVWRMASEVLERLKVTPTPRPRRPLPPVYSIHLPKHQPTFEVEPKDGQPLPDTQDYKRRLAPFDGELEIVARVMRRPAENLLYRASALMEEVAPSDTWTATVEARWRAILEAADMKFAYRRPRTRVARHAMYRALSEILDAGFVHPDSATYLWESLRPYDLDFLLRCPQPRPPECMPLLGLTEHHDPPDTWHTTESCHHALMRVMRTVGGRHVLGEATVIRQMGWNQPEESVESGTVRATGQMQADLTPWSRLGIPYCKAHYLGLSDTNDGLHLLVRNSDHSLDTSGANWLALDPVLAQELGWLLSDEGLFRWVGPDGQVRAESLWWSDGSLAQHAVPRDDEVAAGWIVVCSEAALAELSSGLGHLQRIAVLKRSLTRDHTEFGGQARLIEDL